MSRRSIASGITIALVLIVGSTAAAQQQAAAAPKNPPLSQPTGALSVYDSKNRLVGHVVTFIGARFVQELASESEIAGTAFIVGAPMIRLRAGQAYFYLVAPVGDFNTIEGGIPIPNSPLVGTVPLFYESADCTGPPFIAGVGDVAIGSTGMHGWVVYVPDETILSASIVARSTGTGFECTPLDAPSTVERLYTKRLIDLGPQKWKPPFSIR